MRLEKRQIKLNEMEFFSAFVTVSPAEINSKFSAHNSDILIFFSLFSLSDFSARSPTNLQCSYAMAKLDLEKIGNFICIYSLSNVTKTYEINKKRVLPVG